MKLNKSFSKITQIAKDLDRNVEMQCCCCITLDKLEIKRHN